MNANRIKIVKADLDQYVNIPINMTWDFLGREDSIEDYEVEMIKEVIGSANDFEIARFANNIDLNQDSSINYDFYFYDNASPISAVTVTSANWGMSYLNEGFSVQDVYYYSKPFTKSFFKLDFYDTDDEKTQQIFLSIILPVQQGLTEPVTLSPTLPPVEIKKPQMVLDYIGDKEGFFIYWLRNREFVDINEFFMTGKFFDGRLGVFVQMTNTPQTQITPNKFNFNNADYYYYKVKLDYNTKTYEVFSTATNLRVGGTTTPIKWYEYVNP